MIDATPHDEGDVAAFDRQEVRQIFLGRVHQVLEEGYKRVDASAHQASPEPAITGELVRSMNGFLREMDAPEWADHFSVHDDPPVNDDVRFGKERNRIDIRVDSAKPRPGSSFAFEAKRLARGYTVSKYLGEEGLGCILCGDYARDNDDAGMVGYMQDDDSTYWSAQVEQTIRANLATYQVSEVDWWKPYSFPQGPAHCFVSKHVRSRVGRPVAVYHSLLLFRSPDAAATTAEL